MWMINCQYQPHNRIKYNRIEIAYFSIIKFALMDSMVIHVHHVDNALVMQLVIRCLETVLVVSVSLVGKDCDVTKVNVVQ